MNFFHRLVRMLQLKNSITVLKSTDIVLQEPANIEAHTLEFYRNLFAANNNTQQNNFIELVIQIGRAHV